MGPRRSRRVIFATVVVAGLLGIEVTRLTLAGIYPETRPELAESLAPRLPGVLVSSAMAQVGQAAAQGQTPPQSAMESLARLTRVAPLRTEPLLVQAAVAQRAGEVDRAEWMLSEALRRDPRSPAARYLLADLWVRQGHVAEGLRQMAILSRLLPGSTAQLASALSEYAGTPGAETELVRMLRTNPQLEQPLLSALAQDPDNLPLILKLDRAAPGPRMRKAPGWHAALLNGLVRRGDYEQAYGLWRRFAGFNGERPLLFNKGFAPVAAPPPFNWTFNSSSAGVVEPGNGRMRVLYYGRANAVLAFQLLLLPPGSYDLSMNVSGNAAPDALAWSLYCLAGKKPLAQLELGPSSPARARFEVPESGCEAQMLELRGRVLDVPKDSDVLIGPAEIQRSRG